MHRTCIQITGVAIVGISAMCKYILQSMTRQGCILKNSVSFLITQYLLLVSMLFVYIYNLVSDFFWIYFQRSTFVGSAWSFCFFIPATTANDLRL